MMYFSSSKMLTGLTLFNKKGIHVSINLSLRNNQDSSCMVHSPHSWLYTMVYNARWIALCHLWHLANCWCANGVFLYVVIIMLSSARNGLFFILDAFDMTACLISLIILCSRSGDSSLRRWVVRWKTYWKYDFLLLKNSFEKYTDSFLSNSKGNYIISMYLLGWTSVYIASIFFKVWHNRFF